MNTKKITERISELMSRFRVEVENLNSLNLYDINIHAENVIIPILNSVYGMNFKNANLEDKNAAAIDLIDNENRVAIQVTSTPNIGKIKHTLRQYKKYKINNDFDQLLIYIITKKQKTYSDVIINEIVDGEFEFSPSDHILDAEDILSQINSWISIPKKQMVLDLLELEFTDEKLDLRKYNLENKDLFVEEVLYPNLLEVSIPDTVFVGTIGVDRDEIITSSWETDYKLRRSASEKSVINRAFALYDIKYSKDWHVFEHKIISFKQLDSRSEPLSKLVEIGTVEEYSISDFVGLGFKYEQAMSKLIDCTIQELAFKKGIQWVSKERFFRFRPPFVPGERKIQWKNKKKATRAVVKDFWNSDKTQIVYFRHLSFYIQPFLSDKKWLVSITPSWSFTYDGYRVHKNESDLITKKKMLETNNAIYQHFMFISYCLSNKLSEEEEDYTYIQFEEPKKLMLSYTKNNGY